MKKFFVTCYQNYSFPMPTGDGGLYTETESIQCNQWVDAENKRQARVIMTDLGAIVEKVETPAEREKYVS